MFGGIARVRPSMALVAILIAALLLDANLHAVIQPSHFHSSVVEARKDDRGRPEKKKEKKSQANNSKKQRNRKPGHRTVQAEDGPDIGRDDWPPCGLIPPGLAVLTCTPPDTVIYESTASTSHECSQDFCDEAGVKNGKFRVDVTPQLSIQDTILNEYVAGRVKGETTASKDRVRYMTLGGALLKQDNDCEGIYEAEQLEAFDETFHQVKRANRSWTKYYQGLNDCWAQTGHNYFKIKTSPRHNWESFVFDDKLRDM